MVPALPAKLPKITVVTPSFNSIHTIRETIESVRAQNYPDLEHIVMDGGSKDGTVDLLREYPHLVWTSQQDKGHYFAMNEGIRRAGGGVVNILNADDCFRPGALLAVGEAFSQHPEWDALFGDLVYVDSNSEEIYRREEACYDYDVLRYSICYVIHPTLFVRKSVHERLGVFRADEFLNACDYEFILRIGRAGCRVGHLPQLLVNYRYHDHGQSADLRITRNTARECEVIAREYGKPPGWRGNLYRQVFRIKRQLQKLRCRGRCDGVPGTWKLRGHLHAKTNFTSNIDLGRLKS